MQFSISEVVYQKPIEELELSVRAYNALRRAKMQTIEDILDRQEELYKIKQCGVKSVKEIKNKILAMQEEYISNNN